MDFHLEDLLQSIFRVNRSFNARFLRQKKWDLSEQTMPQQHLRPYGYTSQMAFQDNKLKPHAVNLTSFDRRKKKRMNKQTLENGSH